jgi:hypothetical protein
VTGADIEAARAVIAAASGGPKRWVTNVPGGQGGKSVEEQVLEMFTKHGPEVACHGVAMPVDGQPVESLDDGEALYVCLTGNGPTSAANARYIAGSFDPVAGWAAALDEVERLRARLADFTVPNGAA